jgi:pyruvate formate lyase activating enzyme
MYVQMKNLKGLVYDLQHFAIHDGPGIRTLVYMKGCPLKCLWCSTPQTQKGTFEIIHIETNCQECGRCVETCPVDAITISEDTGLQIDRKRCTHCADCVEACPHQALEFAGKHMTVEELFKEIDKDSPFYRRSNGGVTIGGGEATMQHEYVSEVLKMCKKRYIHTAMETCGFVKWEHLEKILEYLDLVYMDIKHMDPIVHEELTGVSNELILENARRTSDLRPLIIRIPVVPGCNDSHENISATAKFAAELGDNFMRIELLPYHQFGTQTYSRLGRDYMLSDVEAPTEDQMNRLKMLVESCGVDAQIGG